MATEDEDTQKPVETKLSPAVTVVFISLLIDLLAFTLILPLLPSLLDFYEEHDRGGLYSLLVDKIKFFQEFIGAPNHFNTVLFGGFIGSLFSFLQFCASPVIGALSDVYGRKPLLLLSMAGEIISYFLWAISKNFTIFVLSRIVGGISKGNVSISTAIIADVSTPSTRGKGMALIGVAFSVGFILGPITGAMFSHWFKSQAGGYHFVWPALLALTLAVIDFAYLAVSFKETLKVNEKLTSIGSGLSNAFHYINPVSLFQFKAVHQLKKQDATNMQKIGLVYFLYLFLYSGLEFTLTFLTHLRFQYTSVQQGKMFLFIGLTMAAIQGSYVRRVSPGKEKRMALIGLYLIIPSFIIIGFAMNSITLYAGLALYSFASATVVPCLSTIVAAYGSLQQKGTVMGIFRSLGALARSLGPIAASIAFWLLGATTCYIIGGILFVFPILLLRKIKL